MAENGDDLMDMITDVYGQFMQQSSEDSEHYILPTSQLKDAMTALGLEIPNAKQMKQITKTVDNNGNIEFESFAEVMSLMLKEQNKDRTTSLSHDKVIEAYKLFVKDPNQSITINDLRRISNEIKDNATEDELFAMISLFGKQKVDLQDFEQIMNEIS
jgi:Ca2+-binding EF-hand superfamily protein